MKFKSYIGKRVVVKEGKEILFGDEVYETDNQEEIDALKKALEVVQVGGDGTDGSGRKVKLSESLTLEPRTSPEADSLAVTDNTSDAELLLEQVHEKDAEYVVKADSTQARNDAIDEAKRTSGGKLSTEQLNAIDEKLHKNNNKK